jgi:hypothetical protein
VLLGLTDEALSKILQDPVEAIKAEFEQKGSAEDRENLRCVLNGLQRPGWGSGISLKELMKHPHAVTAKIKLHHVLGLRLYTTSSYYLTNDPLRNDPVQRPHPFGATMYFIDQGIKMMRAVAANLPGAHEAQTYWRGMRDLGLTMEFMSKGGTEFACVSTSASQAVAAQFAMSALPLIFKFETKDFAQRGADISFLSVHPSEMEALYPPLTYLRPIKTEQETIAGMKMLVASVEPVFM